MLKYREVEGDVKKLLHLDKFHMCWMTLLFTPHFLIVEVFSSERPSDLKFHREHELKG